MQPAPAKLSLTQRLGAGVLDVSVVSLACGIFIEISQGFHASAPADAFEAAVLTCAIFLIAVFYSFLFKMGGRGTPGQNWQKRRCYPFGMAEGLPYRRQSSMNFSTRAGETSA